MHPNRRQIRDNTYSNSRFICIYQKKVVSLQRILCACVYYEGIIDCVGADRGGGFAAECGRDSEEGS